MAVKQYEIVLVNLDPTVGSEIRKTRPCAVVSPDEINRNLRTVVVAPMTSAERPYPTRVTVTHGGRKGAVALDQVRTIDKGRIIKSLGKLTAQEAIEVKAVIREVFVD